MRECTRERRTSNMFEDPIPSYLEYQKYILGAIKNTPSDVMVCAARRVGKTHMACELIEWIVDQDKSVSVVTFKASADEIRHRTGKKRHKNVRYITAPSSLRGDNSDYIIVEEAAHLRKDLLDDVATILKFPFLIKPRVIMFFTPIPYRRADPPLIKKLWDETACMKFQIGGWQPGAHKDDYTVEEWQTEVEGNWMCV
jgi:hypothetical protein